MGSTDAGTVLLTGAEQLVVGPTDGRADADQKGESVLEIIQDGAVAIEDGVVVASGETETVRTAHPPTDVDRQIDASGKTVLPGFVDSHTHAAFVGDRSDEFAAKLRGKSYQDILEAGGGILRTVEAVRAASDSQLVDRLCSHLDTMLAHGTTTVEVKSGYGLDTEHELRLLAAIRKADKRHPIRVVPTFMGAHAVPDDVTTPDYVEAIIDEQLPAVADQAIARFCDVFCEEGVFDVEQSRRILQAGREHGLTPKIHADEFVRLGGASLAAELQAGSADHLLRSTEADADDLAAAAVTPTLLPATAFGLDTAYADPRPFLDAGAEVAIASDFNPNCYAPGMNFTVTLACAGMKLSPAEAIRASTVGGATALGTDPGAAAAVPNGTGTLTPGAPGDLVVLDAPSIDHVPYRFGENLTDLVVINGEIVVDRRDRT